jgi:hypothetical protein
VSRGRRVLVSGRPAWEEKEDLRGNTMLFERYVCGVGRFYVLTFVWPASESRPPNRSGDNGFFSSGQMTVRQFGEKSPFHSLTF